MSPVPDDDNPQHIGWYKRASSYDQLTGVLNTAHRVFGCQTQWVAMGRNHRPGGTKHTLDYVGVMVELCGNETHETFQVPAMGQGA